MDDQKFIEAAVSTTTNNTMQMDYVKMLDNLDTMLNMDAPNFECSICDKKESFNRPIIPIYMIYYGPIITIYMIEKWCRQYAARDS